MAGKKRKLNEHDAPEPTEKQSSNTSQPATIPAKSSFSELGLDARLLQALQKEKLTAPTSIQSNAIPLILSGKDVLARARTGSGKTLAYLLPVLHSTLQLKAAGKRNQQTSTLILVPSKELAAQVTAAIKTFTAFCAHDLKCENVTRKEDDLVTKARLAEKPDVVVATPARASHWVNNNALLLDQLAHLVVDEADLVLSYGYEDDLKSLVEVLPAGVQKTMMSATLRTEVDTLTSIFFPGDAAKPEILDLSAEEAAEKPKLAQFVVRTAEDEKFLLIYAIFKLQLIRGKVIAFVADIDRCYRVKLFLEQFGIRSCVLNSELPVNSRLHVVEEFNRGVYDIIIAADDSEVIGDEGGRRKKKRKVNAVSEQENDTADAEADDDAVDEDGEEIKTAVAQLQKNDKGGKKSSANDREYGISRGIDFRNVTCVLNFDLPATSKSYTHRIGRTARGSRTGMALSFYVPSDLYRKHKPTSIPECKFDEDTLSTIKTKQLEKGNEIQEWGLDWTKLDAFRYRLADALRAVTRIAVREARTKELRNELIKSEKLKRHFEENPEDLQHLRHDTESHAIRQQPHLRHVPEYLLPSGGKQAVTKDVGFVGIHKDERQENRIRKARAVNRKYGKGRIAKTKGLDPLKSLNVRGRAKK